jgi:gliding motility associated protien GldN
MKALKICFMMLLALPAAMLFGQAETRVITESSDPLEDEYVDDILPKRLIFETKVLPYEPVREADLPWEKRIWRVIDVREKLNLPFTYPDMPFFKILADAVGNGEIKAFAAGDDKFTTMLTPEEVLNQLVTMDTVTVYDPDTYEETVKITRSELNPEDIKRFRVKEIWYFDEEASRMKVRILGIAPVRDYYDKDTGIFKFEGPMFWVYYPEVREVLARHRVFNEANDAAPMTWYDLFEMRQFSSYIFKSSNVLDYRLQDFYPNDGIDRLMESENIKSELFNWEHDLWTY